MKTNKVICLLFVFGEEINYHQRQTGLFQGFCQALKRAATKSFFWWSKGSSRINDLSSFLKANSAIYNLIIRRWCISTIIIIIHYEPFKCQWVTRNELLYLTFCIFVNVFILSSLWILIMNHALMHYNIHNDTNWCVSAHNHIVEKVFSPLKDEQSSDEQNDSQDLHDDLSTNQLITCNTTTWSPLKCYHSNHNSCSDLQIPTDVLSIAECAAHFCIHNNTMCLHHCWSLHSHEDLMMMRKDQGSLC